MVFLSPQLPRFSVFGQQKLLNSRDGSKLNSKGTLPGARDSLIANLSFKWLWHSTRSCCNYKPLRSLLESDRAAVEVAQCFNWRIFEIAHRRNLEASHDTKSDFPREKWVTRYNISIDVRIFRSDNISDRPFHPLWLWWDYFSLNRTLLNVFIARTLPLELNSDSKADFRCLCLTWPLIYDTGHDVLSPLSRERNRRCLSSDFLFRQSDGFDVRLSTCLTSFSALGSISRPQKLF